MRGGVFQERFGDRARNGRIAVDPERRRKSIFPCEELRQMQAAGRGAHDQ